MTPVSGAPSAPGYSARGTRVEVRRAVPDDAGRATAIAREAKARWGYPAEWLALWEPELTLDAAYLATHVAFVAERDGEALGVSAIEDCGTAWSLAHVWVRPAAAEQGIGRALVAAALEAAAALHPDPVHVVSDAHAAGFYVRLGALPAGSIPAPMPGAPHRTLPCFQFLPGASLSPEPDARA